VAEAQGYTVTRAEAREMARWHVHELRKVLEEAPRHPRFIITVHDIGYRLIT
jgi:DNA-binding response OmpR family regulator